MTVHFDNSTFVGAKSNKKSEGFFARRHRRRLNKQFRNVSDNAEQYAYLTLDEKLVKHLIVESPHVGSDNWRVRRFGKNKPTFSATYSDIVRITGSLEDSGIGK